MLGVPIDGPAMLFGDNQSVIINCFLSTSTLKKKHNAIAYHWVREAVAAGVLNLAYLPSKENVANMLTKPLELQQHYPLMSKFLI